MDFIDWIVAIVVSVFVVDGGWRGVADAVEAKLKEKNGIGEQK
jgi:hypothetical protein